MIALRCSVVGILSIGLLGQISLRTVTAQDTVPFVIGYERFARHDEIKSPRAGQLLVVELGCTNCHQTTNELLVAKQAPALKSVGTRLQSSWLAAFLKSPSGVHSGTTMPDLLSSLADSERMAAVEALAGFLTTQREPFPEIKASGANPVPFEFYDRGNAEQGSRLYHSLGCIACHEPDANFEAPSIPPSDLDKLLDTLEPEELAELGLSASARRVASIPIPNLTDQTDQPAKYTRKSLTYFLMNPEQSHPAGRMPSLGLKPVEAADIAAYLTSRSTISATASRINNSERLVGQGRQLFEELKCNNCHQLLPVAKVTKVKPLNNLDLTVQSSCVQRMESASTAIRKRGQPLYRVDAAQLNSLQDLIRHEATRKANPIKPAEVAADRLELTMLLLNCYGCHDRNAMGGMDRFRKPYFETVNQVDIGDEGRLPPTLSHAGKKLKSDWMEKVLKGEGTIRPHMTIRMPVYSKQNVKDLPQLFSSCDGPGPSTSVFAKAEVEELRKVGRQLMDLGCVQCHSFRGQALPGVVGVDLADVDKRIQSKYLHDFLKDPNSLKQRTRMPTFFPEGKTQFADILNGSVELQLSAIVAYLSDIKNQPLPQKIQDARSQNFELSPKEHPIVLRTFMPVAGFHAIAVGFPEQLHFALDAQRCNLAEAWLGKFIDAEATWFDRFAKPAEPLGTHRTKFPAGPPIALLNNKQSPWPSESNSELAFKGYALDSQQVPTFSYQLESDRVQASYQIYDQISPRPSANRERSGNSQTNSQTAGSPVAFTGLHRKLRIEKSQSSNTNSVEVNSAPKASKLHVLLYARVLVGKRIVRQPPSKESSSTVYSNEDGLTVYSNEDGLTVYSNEDGLTVTIANSSAQLESRTQSGWTELLVPLSLQADESSQLELLYRWKGMP